VLCCSKAQLNEFAGALPQVFHLILLLYGACCEEDLSYWPMLDLLCTIAVPGSVPDPPTQSFVCRLLIGAAPPDELELGTAATAAAAAATAAHSSSSVSPKQQHRRHFHRDAVTVDSSSDSGSDSDDGATAASGTAGTATAQQQQHTAEQVPMLFQVRWGQVGVSGATSEPLYFWQVNLRHKGLARPDYAPPPSEVDTYLAEERALLAQLFARYDADCSESIDREELRFLLQDLGMLAPLVDATTETLFPGGALTWDTFREWWERNRAVFSVTGAITMNPGGEAGAQRGGRSDSTTAAAGAATGAKPRVRSVTGEFIVSVAIVYETHAV
jgi:hypothetical protein